MRSLAASREVRSLLNLCGWGSRRLHCGPPSCDGSTWIVLVREQSKQSLEHCKLLNNDRRCVCYRERFATVFETAFQRFHRPVQADTDIQDLCRNWGQCYRAPRGHANNLAKRPAHVMN